MMSKKRRHQKVAPAQVSLDHITALSRMVVQIHEHLPRETRCLGRHTHFDDSTKPEGFILFHLKHEYVPGLMVSLLTFHPFESHTQAPLSDSTNLTKRSLRPHADYLRCQLVSLSQAKQSRIWSSPFVVGRPADAGRRSPAGRGRFGAARFAGRLDS